MEAILWRPAVGRTTGTAYPDHRSVQKTDQFGNLILTRPANWRPRSSARNGKYNQPNRAHRRRREIIQYRRRWTV
jgi:hypothetical protein